MSDQAPSSGSSVTAPPAAPAGTPTKEECNMAMLIYILAIFTGWVGPLIIWLVKKDASPFINDQGKEVLNFQITFFLAYIVSALLMFVVIGCILMPALFIASLVFCIMGAMAASKGTAYRFPFNIRLIK
jgi:uncharacterized Tic20 family protein